MLPTKVHSVARLAAPALIALGFLAGASAQQAPAASTSGTESAAEIAAAHAARASVAEFRAVRVTRLIGMNVRGPKGENVGKVRDLIVNAANGRVRYAVMEFDPGIFTAERLVPVPVSLLRLAPDRSAIIYNPAPARLEKAALDKVQWNDQWLSDPKRITELDQAWGLPRRPVAISAYRGSTLIDREVKGSSGEPIGKIEDVVVHLNQQKVNYAVFRADPKWAGQDKRLAIPITRFKTGGGGANELVLDVSRQQVQGMQGLEYEQGRSLDERAFMADINQHLAAFTTARPSQRRAEDAGKPATPAAPAAEQGAK